MSLAATIERSQRDKENWRYTDLAKLLKPQAPQIAPALPPAAPVEGFVRFTFIDGVLQRDPSESGDLPATVLRGDSANGYQLVVDGQTCLATQPVEFLFLSSGTQAEINIPLRIELGANGRLTLIERHEGNGSGTVLINLQISLKAQAKLVHGKTVRGGQSSHIAMTQVDVAEGGYYDHFALILDGRVTRDEIHLQLAGQMAQARLNGAMLLSGSAHADTTTHITHAMPHGSSRQLYKTVLADKAHGVFQGKVIVATDAQKTDANQLSRALLLSDQAEMNAKPQLEIYADDVKCSHGSTVGELDAEALFYLQSRGLNEAAAKALLLEAFVGEIVDDIPVSACRDIARDDIRRWLNDRKV